ncbi:hypothetical protein [Paenibacillus sp. IHBB 10380]|uniref:hypothetical protein n=1 Tax=Paenibacillus sp. IHBB 10380 TaxID=1566358 RepID=UPI0005CFE8E3|nr:hypothetical protein [Paenibacillus sp. IHBB 10380]AJS59840.1 hypothetical protein UB51_16660 [Paenibacillus sp. IHBB 10380]
MSEFLPVQKENNNHATFLDDYRMRRDASKQARLKQTGYTILETAATSEHTHNGGGGGGMDELLRRIENLEDGFKELKQDIKGLPTTAHLELLQKSLIIEMQNQTKEIRENVDIKTSSLPNDDRMKTIISEQVRDNGIATKTYVSAEISKASNTNLRWIIGLGVPGLIAIAVGLLKLFL